MCVTRTTGIRYLPVVLALSRAVNGRAKRHDVVAGLLARPSIGLGALVLVSAVIIATAVSNYHEINKELTAVALARRATVAQLTALTLAQKFERAADIAISLATRARFRRLVAQGRWDEAIQIMRDVPRDLPYIDRLFLADFKGTLKADIPALPGVRGVNFAYRDWFQGVRRQDRPYVSSVYTRAAAPRLEVFAVSVPVTSEAGRVVGILVLQMRVESLHEWVAQIDQGPGGFIYMVDPKGQVVFDSKQSHRSDRGGVADRAGASVLKRLQRGREGVEIAFDKQAGEDVIRAYATAPGYGWAIVAQQPTSASPGLKARDQQLRRLFVGYALILLLCAAAIFLASQIAAERERAGEDRRAKAELERRVIERTHELAAANQELEAFSYSVSHDLRAPLRAIDGFGQALLEDHAGRLDDEGRGHLQRIRHATQRMGQLIDDLLKLSRATRMEINREQVDLSQIAKTVLDELQKADPERRVSLWVEGGMVVEGDARLLRIVLENLVGNAWKFSGRANGPRIEFYSVADPAGARAYCVRDNGVGFDMAYADKLFGAFQRLHVSTDFPGTGIGLATVQRIVHRHRGRVWAESEIGKGACFCFTLDPSRPI